MKQVVLMLALCVTALLSVWMITESSKKSGVVEAIEARRSIRAYKDIPVAFVKMPSTSPANPRFNAEIWRTELNDVFRIY